MKKLTISRSTLLKSQKMKKVKKNKRPRRRLKVTKKEVTISNSFYQSFCKKECVMPIRNSNICAARRLLSLLRPILFSPGLTLKRNEKE